MQIIWSNASRCLEATCGERRGLITEVIEVQFADSSEGCCRIMKSKINPDWLGDNTQPVMEWKDRAFKEIKSLDHSTRYYGPGTFPGHVYNFQPIS